MTVQRPTVVFVHGFLDTPSVWSAVEAAQDGPTIAIDLSRSSSVSLDTYADLVVNAVEGSGGERVVLVGHSMGAQVAELAAARLRPARVAGLVLISPVPLQGLPVPDEMAGALRGCGGNPGLQRTLRQQLAANLSNADLDAVVSGGSSIPVEDVAAMFDAWSQGHPAGNVPTTVETPTTILFGDQDPFISADIVEQVVHPRFPTAAVAAVHGSGHWPALEQPAAVVEMIRTTVDAATARAR